MQNGPLTAAGLKFLPNPFKTGAELEKFLDWLLKRAYDDGENAGYSGAMHDGGRGRLEEQVAAFNAGFTNASHIAGLPVFWERYTQEYFREHADPAELALYKKLHMKYGDS